MEITLINRTNQDVSVYASLFQKIAKSAEKILELPEDYELSVTFVRSQTIHKINRDYRNVDRPTDVISFAIRDDEDDFISEEEKDLGDIFININYCKKQAKEYGHSFERECNYLVIHSVLHLLGYDHMVEEDKVKMREREEELLNKLGISRW